MPPSRAERYNAKARRSVAGASSHKKKRPKRLNTDKDEPTDPNAPILDQKSKEEKEATRRDILREELLAPNQAISSKKKRRLEKYIEKQLKKEERVHILQQLAETQAQIPSTKSLKSSATLGSGRIQSAADHAAIHEHLQIRDALGHSKLQAKDETDSDENDRVDSDSGLSTLGAGRSAPIIVAAHDGSHLSKATTSGASIHAGSALRSNGNGAIVPSSMKSRGLKSRKFPSWKDASMRKHSASDRESSDFDSSDSGFDSEGIKGMDQIVCEDENMQHKPSIGSTSISGQKRPFKEWAHEQIGKTMLTPVGEYQTYTNIEAMKEAEANLAPSFKRQKHDDDLPRGPMGAKIEIPNTEFARRAQREQKELIHRKIVSISRSDDVRAARMQLPILAEEQRILEAVLLHPVVVICGQTGSGKTTQVPQFLYEAGYGHTDSQNPGIIGITQPRRVAAISMAARVAEELSLPPTIVSHQVRYEATAGSSTVVKFMTDGVLLREMAADFLLSRYSVIIVDEAHERNLNTDILIGTLSRVIKLRAEMWLQGKAGAKPLRLIIMSATLRVSDFVENTILFNIPPPIIEIETRQHPVTIHFDRRTRSDYVTQALAKAVKIHSRLPPGGILIFLTGQQEIVGLCRKLERRFGYQVIHKKLERRRRETTLPPLPNLFPQPKEEILSSSRADWDVEVEEMEFNNQAPDLGADIDEGREQNSDNDALDTDEEEIVDSDNNYGTRDNDIEVPMHVLPLYSLLSSEKQMAVFKPPPEGSRLVVVATNVAETSLTIPGIRYVIDCGRAKERNYDAASGVQTFQISWISKASAAQRAGRAGRTGPGHCYRLYSSSLFEHYFDEHSKPEILRTPIEGVVLQMKCMHIDAIVNFPFPTPPDRTRLQRAELVLTRLGAIEKSLGKRSSQITDLGLLMSAFPVEPRLGKMLANGTQHGCLPYVIAVVAVLTVGDPFLREEELGLDGQDNEESEDQRRRRALFFEKQKLHSQLGGGRSDAFRLLSIIGAFEYAGGSTEFCREHFIRPKAMEEIRKLRRQLSAIASSVLPQADPQFVAKLPPPNALQLKVLRQVLAAGFIDQVAVRKDIVEKGPSGNKYASSRNVAYRAVDVEEDVFIHPSSILYHQPPPEYIVYREIVRGTRTWLKIVTVVNVAWLAQLGPAMCTYSKPLPVPPTVKDMKPGEVLVIPKFGPGWELPPFRRMK